MKKNALFPVISFLLLSCGSPQAPAEPPGPKWDRTCVALSVGSFDGIAHLGALKALQESDIPIECVAGTSMGAIVGAMYAANPKRDQVALFNRVLDDYYAELKGKGFFGTIGALWDKVAHPDKVSHEKLVKALRAELRDLRIEEMAIPFVTAHSKVVGTGTQVESSATGDLVDALAASTANPLIFHDLERVKRENPIDPGVDRIARVPLELACTTYPNSRIIVINVTGKPAEYTTKMDCIFEEIMIPSTSPDIRKIFDSKGARQALIDHGYNVTRQALGGAAVESVETLPPEIPE